MPLLEIAATSLEDALNAARGGADSIEISRDLSVGGLTPNVALVAEIVQRLRNDRLAIHVMVRPHPRSFVYDDDDIQQIRESVCAFKSLGVSSIVFGARDTSNHLDMKLIQHIKNEAAPIPLTVHRALDLSVEPERSIEQLAAIGIKRVLTAGPAKNAWDGRKALAGWIDRFGSSIEFVASGGLTGDQCNRMQAMTRAHVYHFGSAARSLEVVDTSKVSELRAILK